MIHHPKEPTLGDRHLSYWLAQPTEIQPSGYVYVIRAEGDDPIKVGRAIDVRKRLSGLQTGNPRPLYLLYVFPDDGELEWQLHRRLKKARMSGEWFGGPEAEQFLAFAEELSTKLVRGCELLRKIPDYREIGTGWFKKGHRGSVTKVTRGHDPRFEQVGRLSSANKDLPTYRPTPDPQFLKAVEEMEVPAFTPHRPS